MIRYLAPYCFWGFLALVALGQLPPPLLGALLEAGVALLVWPLRVLGPLYGGATLAVAVGVAVGGIGAALAHDAVLLEDNVAAKARADEVYRKRRWLPW